MTRRDEGDEPLIPPVAPPPVPAPEPLGSGRRSWRRLLIAALVLAAAAGWWAVGDYGTFETLRDHREALLAFRDANYLLTVALFMLGYMAVILLALPAALIASLTGGFLFGLFPGVVYNVTASTVGSVLIFLAVRWGVGARVAARIEVSEGRLRAFKRAVDENAFSAVLTVRLIPVIPFFATNISSALLGIRLAPFLAATALGGIPGGIVYTWVGAGLGEVFERGDVPDLGLIFEWPILGPLMGLAVLSALPTLMRLWQQRRRERRHG